MNILLVRLFEWLQRTSIWMPLEVAVCAATFRAEIWWCRRSLSIHDPASRGALALTRA